MYYVYVMFRPDGRPCYAGKGQGKRAYEFKRRHNKHLCSIARAAGGSLHVEKTAAVLSNDEAIELEQLSIAMIGRKAHGGPLVNQTDGGHGSAGYKFSAETIAKRTASRRIRGVNFSPEGRARISAAVVRRYENDPLLRERMSAQLKAKRASDPSIAEKMLASARRRLSDPIERKKMGDAFRGKSFTADHKEKIRQSLLGRKKSPEHCAAMTKAWIKRKAKKSC